MARNAEPEVGGRSRSRRDVPPPLVQHRGCHQSRPVLALGCMSRNGELEPDHCRLAGRQANLRRRNPHPGRWNEERVLPWQPSQRDRVGRRLRPGVHHIERRKPVDGPGLSGLRQDDRRRTDPRPYAGACSCRPGKEAREQHAPPDDDADPDSGRWNSERDQGTAVQVTVSVKLREESVEEDGPVSSRASVVVAFAAATQSPASNWVSQAAVGPRYGPPASNANIIRRGGELVDTRVLERARSGRPGTFRRRAHRAVRDAGRPWCSVVRRNEVARLHVNVPGGRAIRDGDASRQTRSGRHGGRALAVGERQVRLPGSEVAVAVGDGRGRHRDGSDGWWRSERGRGHVQLSVYWARRVGRGRGGQNEEETAHHKYGGSDNSSGTKFHVSPTPLKLTRRRSASPPQPC